MPWSLLQTAGCAESVIRYQLVVICAITCEKACFPNNNNDSLLTGSCGTKGFTGFPFYTIYLQVSEFSSVAVSAAIRMQVAATTYRFVTTQKASLRMGVK